MEGRRPSSESLASRNPLDVELSEHSLDEAERNIARKQAATEKLFDLVKLSEITYESMTEQNVTLDILETGVRVAEERYEEAKRSLLNQEDPFGPHSYLDPMEPLGAEDRTYTTEEISELQRLVEKANQSKDAYLEGVDDIGKKVLEAQSIFISMRLDLQKAKAALEEVRASLHRESPTDHNDGNSAPTPSDQWWPEDIEDPANIISLAPKQEESSVPTESKNWVSDKSAPSPPGENDEWTPDKDDKDNRDDKKKRRAPVQKTGAVKKRRSQKKTTTRRK